MKVVYKGKIDNIERVSNDTVRFRMQGKAGRVADASEKIAPNAKESEMSLEFVLRPAMADEIRIGQVLVVTVEAAGEE
jgi:hypothetical protein